MIQARIDPSDVHQNAVLSMKKKYENMVLIAWAETRLQCLHFKWIFTGSEAPSDAVFICLCAVVSLYCCVVVSSLYSFCLWRLLTQQHKLGSTQEHRKKKNVAICTKNRNEMGCFVILSRICVVALQHNPITKQHNAKDCLAPWKCFNIYNNLQPPFIRTAATVPTPVIQLNLEIPNRRFSGKQLR